MNRVAKDVNSSQAYDKFQLSGWLTPLDGEATYLGISSTRYRYQLQTWSAGKQSMSDIYKQFLSWLGSFFTLNLAEPKQDNWFLSKNTAID